MNEFYEGLAARLLEIDLRSNEVHALYSHERSVLEAKYRADLASIQEERLALETLLQIEIKRTGEKPNIPALAKASPRLPLGEFFLATLDKRGPLSKEDLREAALEAGYFETNGGGRTTHTTLMNYSASHKIICRADGLYELPTEPQTLFGLGSVATKEKTSMGLN